MQDGAAWALDSVQAMSARGLLFLALGMVVHQLAASIDARHKAARRATQALLKRVRP